MNFKFVAPVIVCMVGVFFAAFIHQPVADHYPDRIYFQVLGDILSTCEFLSKHTQSFVSNRWWPYSLLSLTARVVSKFKPSPAAVSIHNLELDEFNAVLILPDEFMERTEPGPVIVFYHGGGFVFGSVASYMNLLVNAAKETGFAVMAPEYRLAPVNPYPIPFQDCLKTALHIMKNGNEYNIDPSRVIIAGDSAGGNLALSVTLELINMHSTDGSVQTPKMLALVYPVLQMVNFQLPSYRAFQNHTISPDMIPKSWLSYLGLHDYTHLSGSLMNNDHVHTASNIQAEMNAKLVDPTLIANEYVISNIDDYPQLTSPKNTNLSLNVTEKISALAYDRKVAPLMSSDETLSKLMRTHIMIANYDQLRDEGLILVERLKNVGVDVTLQFLPNSPHATLNVGALAKNSYHSLQNEMFFQHIKLYIDNID